MTALLPTLQVKCSYTPDQYRPNAKPNNSSSVGMPYNTAIEVAAVEGAVLVGGLSALGAALFSIGIPKDSVIQYEQAVKPDGYLVLAHGSADEMARSKAILETSNPTRIDLHENVQAQGPAHTHSAVA